MRKIEMVSLIYQVTVFTVLVLLANFTCCAEIKRLLMNDDDYIETRLKNLESSLRQEFESKMQRMNATITKLQAEVQQTREHVGFYSTLSGHTTLGQKQTLIFDRAITNIGHGYSNVSGVFTVPVAGLYHFSSTTFQYNTGDLHTQMMLNNMEIGRNYGNSHRSSGTINVLVAAQKGDQVYIRHMGSIGSQTIHGDGYSSFSGFLIE